VAAVQCIPSTTALHCCITCMWVHGGPILLPKVHPFMHNISLGSSLTSQLVSYTHFGWWEVL
jgi:hypothetical protein